MPLSLRRGRVTAITERHEELLRLEVDGIPTVAYPRVTGPLEEGDEVLVNTQGRELELGSGGFDVVYANLTRGLGLPSEEGAHVMKLPYTPVQAASRHAEEGHELPATLAGLPVVCCSLHSQVAPVCAGIGSGRRVAYVQLPGGALPVSLSDSVRELRARQLIETAVAVDACIDGDVQCVSVASALLWCAAEGFDVYAPRAPRCCGALQLHYGYDEPAVQLAKETIESLEGCDHVIVNAAGTQRISAPSRVRFENASRTLSGMAVSRAAPVRSSNATATPERLRLVARNAW